MKHDPIDSGTVAAICRRFERVLAPPRRRYVPWRIGGIEVGAIDPERTQHLRRWPRVFVFRRGHIALAADLGDEPARTAALDQVAAALSDAGLLSAWRDERYAVAAGFGAPVLARLERCAARFFGIATYAAHLNAWASTPAGPLMWLARRSRSKGIDPGLLDNLVGGGIAAGADVRGTLVKEAWEEAGIPFALAAQAVAHGSVDLLRDERNGLQRERVFVHDLELPGDFVAANQDGESEEVMRVDLHRAAGLVAGDSVTADASLVIAGFLLRHGAIAHDDPWRGMLERFCAEPRADTGNPGLGVGTVRR